MTSYWSAARLCVAAHVVGKIAPGSSPAPGSAAALLPLFHFQLSFVFSSLYNKRAGRKGRLELSSALMERHNADQTHPQIALGTATPQQRNQIGRQRTFGTRL
jgi:hypothetical protein